MLPSSPLPNPNKHFLPPPTAAAKLRRGACVQHQKKASSSVVWEKGEEEFIHEGRVHAVAEFSPSKAVFAPTGLYEFTRLLNREARCNVYSAE